MVDDSANDDDDEEEEEEEEEEQILVAVGRGLVLKKGNEGLAGKCFKISEPLWLSTGLTSTRRGCWGLLPWHVRSFVELKEEEQEEEEELLLMPHECGG